MSGNNDNLVASQVLNQLAHVMLLVRIEAIGRFIQNQHLGIVHNCLGQAYPSPDTFRQGFDGLLTHRMQINLVDYMLHSLDNFLAAIASNPGNEL